MNNKALIAQYLRIHCESWKGINSKEFNLLCRKKKG